MSYVLNIDKQYISDAAGVVRVIRWDTACLKREAKVLIRNGTFKCEILGYYKACELARLKT